MPPEVVQRIFDPFFTTRGVEGTGLGLAVSWSIVQRHGGTIDVQSEPGCGTRFYIRLPLRRESAAALRAGKPARDSASIDASVLVVDDEPFVAGVLTSILSRNGYRVTTVNSAEDAMERLRTQDPPFDIVVTDHGMPRKNGLQLVTEVKRECPDLPVILLTGWGASLLQRHVVETMPDAVLGKPINQADLLGTIEQTLREQAERRREPRT